MRKFLIRREGCLQWACMKLILGQRHHIGQFYALASLCCLSFVDFWDAFESRLFKQKRLTTSVSVQIGGLL